MRRLPQVPGGRWRARQLVVALTFDDGPLPDRSPRLLEVLAAHEVPASFFMVGRRADMYPEFARRVVQARHLVGSHSYTHENLVGMDPRDVRAQVECALASLRHHTGQPVRYFRPPFTSRDEHVHEAVAAAGQVFVHWSVSVNDTKHDAATIAESVARRLHPGAIVLLHERDRTIDALPRIIADARARGYRFVTLDGRAAAVAEPPESRSGTARRIGSALAQHTAGLVISGYAKATPVVVTGCRVDPVLATAVAWAGAHGFAVVPADGERLASALQAQIARLEPAEVVVVGDELAVGAAAVVWLGKHAPTVRRIAHTSAPATAAALARDAGSRREVLVTTSTSPTTLLLAACTAGRRGVPLFVVPAGQVSGETGRELRAIAPDRIVLVGGGGENVLHELASTGAHIQQVTADSPATMSAALARAFPPSGGLWLASGTASHHSPITAAAASAAEGAALMFVDRASSGGLAEVVRVFGGAGVTVVGDEAEFPHALVDELLGGSTA
ncbi:Peptidoglycan/xylan/chitin deacetylase, PgdA/CDA1 family [Jiangella alkaliphila]|uniref:Peptidoglycan/xylan/chitin deacetylase, PgdA/CDA1 family n=1 Tax=Jiangella alkaliphila TaxID=419479 RepID=A0A1H2L9L3_9ACTN|nr:Peptidoglycan/xylan/chitin deacetylase, PgdA/CDA1 family [Jiangella alkaliphila]